MMRIAFLFEIVIYTTISQIIGALLLPMMQQQQPTGDVNFHALYKAARETRILQGPQVSQPLYERILELNPTDISTSTRLAANSKPNSQSSYVFNNFARDITTTASVEENSTLDAMNQLRNWFQLDVNYTSEMIGILLQTPRRDVRAPIYIVPATSTSAANTVKELPFPIETMTPLQCLVSLFLFGLCIDIKDAVRSCSFKYIEILKRYGFICHCEYNTNLIYAVVSIMPVDLCRQNTLYVVTDWHPRVLNMIRIEENTNDEAVMYIGPDSLALIEHWILSSNTSITDCNNNNTILDLCTGSGIQALCYLKMTSQWQKQHAVCVDRNPRALRFCQLNAALNGIPSESITLIQGDLLKGTGRVYVRNGIQMDQNEYQPLLPLMQELHSTYDVIIANPPYIPVPSNSENNTTTNNGPFLRHGLFSSGGPSGETVFAAVLTLSKSLSNPNGGYIAIVSEFFFRDSNNSGLLYNDNDAARELVQRLQSYWKTSRNGTNNDESECGSDSSKAILFTNELPISRQVYANRRANSVEEVQIWQRHLENERIVSCSPGLIYIQRVDPDTADSAKQWIHHTVPKSEFGSIWTPSNINAIAFTKATCRAFFDW